MNVMDAIRTRRSVRAYDPRPIPAEVMDRMKDALRLAPSACNYQPWTFVLVADAELRTRLGEASRGQLFIADAPVVVVAVGYPENAFKSMGGHGNSVDVDLAIALDHLTLAAAADGLGTCWIGAFDAAAVKRLIRAPEGSKVVALTPLGYPASKDLLHPIAPGRRKAEGDVFVENRFG